MDMNQTYDAGFAQQEAFQKRAVLYWIAKALSVMGAPPMVTVSGIVLVISLTQDITIAVIGLVFLLCVLPIPLGYVLYQVRRGEISNFDMSQREQRIKPYIVTTIATVVGMLAVYLVHPPRLLLILVSAILLQTVLLFVLTLRWKVSAHSAATAALAVLATGLVGMSNAWVLVSIPLVVWSRLYLKRHTPAEAVAGTLLGILVAGAALALNR